MRMMIIEVDGLRVELPMDYSIASIVSTYKQLLAMGCEMNVIAYVESELEGGE